MIIMKKKKIKKLFMILKISTKKFLFLENNLLKIIKKNAISFIIIGNLDCKVTLNLKKMD